MAVNSVQPTDGRSQAMAFVQADTNRLAKKSYREYKRAHAAQDAKFDKNVSKAIFAAPVVAAASDLILRKGVKSAAKTGALWSAGLAAPIAIFAANGMISSASKKVNKAEQKHPGLTIGGLVAATYMGYEAITAGIERLAVSSKANRIADTIINGAKETVKKVKPELKVPENISKPVSDMIFYAKTKTPDFVKNAYKAIKSSPVTENLINAGKSNGKKLVNAAPAILVLGAFASIVGKAVADGAKFSSIKSETKNTQLNTAKELLKVYDAENKDLKAENESLQSQQEEA